MVADKKTESNRLVTVYKLFGDTYLAEFEKCLAVAKVNEKGEIIKVTTFGGK